MKCSKLQSGIGDIIKCLPPRVIKEKSITRLTSVDLTHLSWLNSLIHIIFFSNFKLSLEKKILLHKRYAFQRYFLLIK